MSLRRYANTDAQEEALGAVEGWANKLGFKLRYGTAVGKSPQTVLLDHEHQDGLVRVNSEGEVRFNDEDLRSEELQMDFEHAVTAYYIKHGIKPAGTICGYCGFSRDDGKPEQQAKVGNSNVLHPVWLDVGYETSQKVGKLQLENKLYTLEVCPACAAIIGVIEKP